MTAILIVNGRELTRPVMTSLGYILCWVLPRLSNHFLIDVCTPQGPLHENAAALFDDRRLRRVQIDSDCAGIGGRLRYYWGLFRHVHRQKPDAYWEINHMMAPVPQRTLAAITVHDLYPMIPELNPSRLKAWLFRMNLTASIRLADLVMMPSAATQAELHARIGRAKGAEAILPNGAWDRMPPPRRRGRWVAGGVVLGYLGRLNHWKGVDRLLTLAAGSDHVARLRLAGAADTAYLDSLPQWHSMILEKAEYLGPIPSSDKPAFFDSIDVFAYATRYDGFGIPPLEAMLNRIPVVAADIPVMREVLGTHAIYLRAGAADPLTEALSALEAMDDASFASFLDKAEAHALGYSWERYAAGLKDLLMGKAGPG